MYLIHDYAPGLTPTLPAMPLRAAASKIFQMISDNSYFRIVLFIFMRYDGAYCSLWRNITRFHRQAASVFFRHFLSMCSPSQFHVSRQLRPLYALRSRR